MSINTDNILPNLFAEWIVRGVKMIYFMVVICIIVLIAHSVYVGNWGW